MRTWRVRTASDLGQAIKAIREASDETQGEFAERLQLDRTYLSRMEGSPSSILLDRMLRALRYLGAEVTVTWTVDD